MKIIIVAGAPVKSFAKLYHRNPSDYYIGVDAGCLELIKRGIKIDYAVGDFDSTEELEQIKISSYGVSLHPKEKNETDLELALMHLDSLKGASDLEIEIYDNCTWTWTTQNGHNGYKVTSKKNGNSIFLPAAGWRYGASSYGQGARGYYWSATPGESYSVNAFDLNFHEGSRFTNWLSRYEGDSVRPVCD